MACQAFHRALVVGHSPTNEAAVLGLAGQVVRPLGKGEGILLTEDGGVTGGVAGLMAVSDSAR